MDRKRKAEDVLLGSKTKSLKDGQGIGPKSEHLSTKSQSSNTSKRPILSTSTSALSVPYRGTVKAAPNSASPTMPTGITAKAPPKKGSYAEIMARAKASQAAAAAVGVIKHKPKEALSNKKEILLRKKGLLNDKKAGLKAVRGAPINKGSGLGSELLEAKKQTDAGGSKKGSPSAYKGTATAKPQPSYKGTMKSAERTNSIKRKPSNTCYENGSRGASSIRPSASRSGYVSDQGEDEDEEDGEDIASDLSTDDMEAGFSDVEDEEIHATKFARKEDEEQAKLEARLKKEKEERRKRLDLMAKNAKKRAF